VAEKIDITDDDIPGPHIILKDSASDGRGIDEISSFRCDSFQDGLVDVVGYTVHGHQHSYQEL